MESHLILPLDQKPFLACPLLQAYEEKETVQLSAVEAEGDAARLQARRHVGQRFVLPPGPRGSPLPRHTHLRGLYPRSCRIPASDLPLELRGAYQRDSLMVLWGPPMI